MSVCLGCGAAYEHSGDTCIPCAGKAIAHGVRYKHWPLEVSLSPMALAFIEEAIRERRGAGDPSEPNVADEIDNAVNAIRAHLQHLVEERRAERTKLPTDEELLA